MNTHHPTDSGAELCGQGQTFTLLPRLAQLFSVRGDDLLGLNTACAGKRGPTPKLQQQIERLHRLPKAKQKLVMEMLVRRADADESLS